MHDSIFSNGFSTFTYFELIKDGFKLDNIFHYYLANNNSPHKKLYHGDTHTMNFMMVVALLGSEYNLKYDHIRNLLIASIFHDMNHCNPSDLSDPEYDKINIEEAKKAFLECVSTTDLIKDDVDIILFYIESTFYPHEDIVEIPSFNKIIKKLPIGQILQDVNIMRDADMSTPLFYKTWYKLQMGVYNEIKLKNDLPIKLFWENTKKFISNIRYSDDKLNLLLEETFPIIFEQIDKELEKHHVCM